MRAVEITAAGGPEVLRIAERPAPAPAPGEVLIEVIAAGVNRPDLLQRQGKYPPPKGTTDIPGLEVAGRIVALGAATETGAPGSARGRAWAIGDAVCALAAGGGYAEQVSVPGVQCLPVPRGCSWIEAAALPETYFTVWTNVFERGRLREGEWFLVHGGTSGIGTTAIQLAVARGARVIATAGREDKRQFCERLGAQRAVDYHAEDFVEAVKSATRGRGVDLVLDIVGGAYTARNLDCLARDGRLVQIGTMGGGVAEVPLWQIMAKRLTVTGSTLRARPAEEKGTIAAALEEQVWPLLEAGRARPVIARTMPLDQAAEAHRALEAGEIIGKVVLSVRPAAPRA